MDYLTQLTFYTAVITNVHCGYTAYPVNDERYVNRIPESELKDKAAGVYKAELSPELRYVGGSFCFSTYEFSSPQGGCVGRTVEIRFREDKELEAQGKFLPIGVGCQVPPAAKVKMSCKIDSVIDHNDPLIENEGNILTYRVKGDLCVKAYFTYEPQTQLAIEHAELPSKCPPKKENLNSRRGKAPNK